VIHYENDRRTRAEQHVISALLKNAEMIRHCPQLKARDFSHDLHGMIFRAIEKLIGRDERVNASSVFAELVKTWRASGFSYLLSLEAMTVPPCHVGYYAAIMLEGVKR
jgi:replicative DNA helicase